MLQIRLRAGVPRLGCDLGNLGVNRKVNRCQRMAGGVGVAFLIGRQQHLAFFGAVAVALVRAALTDLVGGIGNAGLKDAPIRIPLRSRPWASTVRVWRV